MITSILGKQGSGKSLLSMFLARQVQAYAYNYYSAEVMIYTNINAGGKGIQVISDLGEVPFNRDPKILIVDEAMFSLDARSASSHDNQQWTRAIAFFRKSNFLLVVFATHDISLMDVRLRIQMDYIFMARRSLKQFEYLMIDTVTYQQKPLYIPHSKELFDYVDYDTFDFPNPISTEKLAEVMTMIDARTSKQKKKEEQLAQSRIAGRS